MKRYLIICITAVLVMSCAPKGDLAKASWENSPMQELLDAQRFEINADWAAPLSTDATRVLNSLSGSAGNTAGNRVSLFGNPNYLRFKGDSVVADLPYFGVRQSGGGYGSATGITFKGIPRDFAIEEAKRGNARTISFAISEKSESYSVYVMLFPNQIASISVNSSQRQSIQYDGTAKALEEK